MSCSYIAAYDIPYLRTPTSCQSMGFLVKPIVEVFRIMKSSLKLK